MTMTQEEIDYLTEIVKTRYNALDYLLYGEFCRNPDLKVPSEIIKISKLFFSLLIFKEFTVLFQFSYKKKMKVK